MERHQERSYLVPNDFELPKADKLSSSSPTLMNIAACLGNIFITILIGFYELCKMLI